MQNFRGSDLSVAYDTRYKANICRFSFIGEIPWEKFAKQIGSQFRIIVTPSDGSLHLDCLYVPRGSSTLLAALHGAINQSKVEPPYFQFVRAFSRERRESLLFLYDTTMLLNLELFTTYFIGDAESDLVTRYAELINGLSTATGVSRTILAGHSAGGVAALTVGAQVHNSLAVASNPFTIDEEFAPHHLENYRKCVFPGCETVDEMVREFAERFMVYRHLERRVESSRFTWFVHQDDASWKRHGTVLRVADRFGIDPYRGNTDQGDALVLVGWEYPKDPHNMPYFNESYTFLPLLHAALGERTNFDLEVVGDTDPASGRG